MKTITKKKLRTNEVIDLWANLFEHVWGGVASEDPHRRLHDGFDSLMSRRDISNRDRVWLRWLAENDPAWMTEAEQEAIDKAQQQRLQVPAAAEAPAPQLMVIKR